MKSLKKKLTIASVASEIYPLSKSGGLADVAYSLPRELLDQGYQLLGITPLYRVVKENAKNNDCILRSVYKDIEIEIQKKIIRFSVSQVNLNHARNDFSVYCIDNYQFFGNRSRLYGYDDDGMRFYVFAKAALKLIDLLINDKKIPIEVVHCHDWHTGLIPYFLETPNADRVCLTSRCRDFATLFTVHNNLFQGPAGLREKNLLKRKKDNYRYRLPGTEKGLFDINFLKRGIMYADLINTVSERYAKELLTPQFGEGLEEYYQKRKKDFYGIINGIEYEVFNPKFDEMIYQSYDFNELDKKLFNKRSFQKDVGLKVDDNVPLIGVSNRLSEQKGFDLITEIIPKLMNVTKRVQIAVVGSGQRNIEKTMREFERKYPGNIAFVYPYSEEMSHQVFAASDLYLMPSRFEPCGLSQLISLRYGSIPIVRRVGGLSDTVKDYNPVENTGNGFVFRKYDPYSLFAAIIRGIETFKHRSRWISLTWGAMKQVFSWEIPAQEYVKLYRKAMRKRRRG